MRETNAAAQNMLLIPAIKRLAEKYHQDVQKQRDLAERESERCTQKRYQVKGEGQWSICKDMGTPNANPMVAVTRIRKGPQGQPAGSVATSPKEVDAICREEYGEIYKGNVSDHKKLVKEYREKYDTKGSKFIYKAKRAKIDAITAEDLQTTARTTKDNCWSSRPMGSGRHQDALYESLPAPCGSAQRYRRRGPMAGATQRCEGGLHLKISRR